MRRIGHHTDPVAYFSSRALAASTVAGHERRWERWIEWCQIHDINPVAARSPQVMVYLHSQVTYWGKEAMRNAADTIAQAHVALGMPDPTVGDVRAYVAATFRALANRGDDRPMTPILGFEAVEICSVPSSAAPAQRASAAHQVIALIAARRHRSTLGPLAGAALRRVGPETMALDLRNGEACVLDGAWSRVASQAFTELERQGTTTLASYGRLNSALKKTADRAGIARFRLPEAADWPEDDFGTVIDWTDVTYATDLRDRTLVICGLELASRGIELGRFDIADFTPDGSPGGGWRVILRNHKTDRSMVGVDHYVGHHHEDTGDWCPACSLGLWLPAGRLATNQIRRIVLKVWNNGGGEALSRIGSRSIRRGSATTAHNAGWTASVIADRLLKHETLESTGRYIDDLTGPEGHFQLPV